MKDHRIYLHHIIEAIEDIERYTASGYDAFMSGRMQQDAVIRKLEAIGEAAKHLSPAWKAMRTDIQWREISAMSDKLIQEYFGVNLEIVWATVEKDLPKLKKAAYELLASR